MSDSDSQSDRDSELQLSKRSRAAHKGKLTTFINFINALPTPLAADDLLNLELRVQNIQSTFAKFDTIQSRLEVLSSDTEALVKERSDFEDLYFKAVAKATGLINLHKAKEVSKPNPEPRASEITDSIKFPEISLPTFTGNFNEWLEFRETFDALINKSSLNPIQKFKYLRSCLQGGALEVVNSIEYTCENYSMAWKLLCERYNNPRLLVSNHLKSLFEVEPIYTEEPNSLRSLLDNLNKHLRSLRSLNVPTDEWDLIIIYFMVAKLPAILQNKWEERQDSKELPSLQEFKGFLRRRADLLDTMASRGAERSSSEKQTKKSLVTTTSRPNPTPQPVKCPQCKGRHYINQCQTFLALNALARIRAAKTFKLCTNCLGTNHESYACRSTTCKYCRGKHHTLLHIDQTRLTTQPTTYTHPNQNSFHNFQPNHEGLRLTDATLPNTMQSTSTSERIHQAQPSATHASSMRTHTNTTSSKKVDSQNKTVFLATAIVRVYDEKNTPHNLRVLLDSASQSNFISDRAYQLLKLTKNDVDMQVIGFNDKSTDIKHYCELKLESFNRKYQTKLTCLIVPNICNLPDYNISIESLQIPQHIKLADENFSSAGEVDILIGAELFYEMLCPGRHRLGDGYPTLQETKLGWIISGAFTAPPGSNQVRCNLSLTSKLKHFWEMEECSETFNPFCETESVSQLSNDDAQCEKVFNTHSRNSDGNFVVNLPLKSPVTALGESKGAAKRRFLSLEKRFARDDNFKQMYIQVMREFELAGRMEKIKNSDVPLNFLPHHAVVNLEKTTTPLRVVFDASCTTSSGYSLNDILYKGTIKQDTLMNILLRFRLHRYVVNADIQKMFCCVYLAPQHQNLQCILWREESHHELLTYKLTTLSFGLKPAPHIATRCLLQLSQEAHASLQKQIPATMPAATPVEAIPSVTAKAATAIAEQFYADDLLFGGDNEQEVTQVVREIDRILKGANFHLRKWKSNSLQVQTNASSTNNQQPVSSQTQNIAFGDKSHKILGLEWASSDDNLLYSIDLKSTPKYVTKRVILSRLSSIFDPLGLIGPILIVAKCYIQRLWVDKSDWDQPISETLFEEWSKFYNKLHHLNKLKIPRQVLINNYVTIELHGFSDSSNQAFGAAIYVRTMDRHGHIMVKLLFAKSRVAPIKTQTIPRLELSAALLLATNMQAVKTALKIPIDKVKCWSDSTIALAWINTEPHRLNTFVANRVTKIQALTDSSSWSWVSTNENPADLLSRGVFGDKFVNCSKTSKLWFEGPSFLSKPSQEWPQNHNQSLSTLPELKPIHKTLCNTTQGSDSTNSNFINTLISKYSSDIKLFKIFAYILRFVHNCKTKHDKCTGPITCKERNESTLFLMKFSQRESFPIEYKLLQSKLELPKGSKIQGLKPFMENDLMRVGGRLSQSQYDYNKKHPIILHSDHTLTQLIMRNEHIRLMHPNPQLLLASVRESFWPIKGKYQANKIVRECVTCFRAKPDTPTPIMGDLPGNRVNPAPPFHTTGLDYAGPFLLRDRRGRGYRTYKSYIAVFICFVTKAVHLELITGMETEAFLAAFRRFTARRGRPHEMVSDNGTTFQGANNDLQELYNFLAINSDEMTASCVNLGITWKFIPAYSPHMGGLWESAVKSCKFHLKRVLGQALLTYEGFSTILIQIEGILNSRPLCPIPSSDTELFHVLTPAHFLIGRTPTALPDYNYEEVPTNRLKYFQQLQQMYQNFWRSFSRDYVGLLQQRTKWRSSKGPSLAAGTVVLLKEDRLPPCRWKVAKIIDTHPGPDRVVRVATMKTSDGNIVKRSFSKICPLPINIQ